MLNDTTTTPEPTATPLLLTTRRGIAAASFSLGLWASLVFWWYPFGIFAATVGLVLGILARLTGWKAEAHGTNLALAGIVLNLVAIGSAVTVHRVMQFYFEDGMVPLNPLPWK